MLGEEASVIPLVVLILALFMWESVVPLKPQASGRVAHILTNLFIFLCARGVLFLVSLLAIEQFAFYSLREELGVFFVVYVFVLSDLSVYWWHRLNHRIPFLWRFHQVHHADSFLDFSTALRFHFGELAISYFVRGSVAILLGFEAKEVLLYNLVLTGANLFHHSNVALPLKLESFLSKLIVTPLYHRTHHSLFLNHTDSNYAALWIGWDHVFHSHSGRIETPNVGLPYFYSQDVFNQSLLPFHKLARWPEKFMRASE